MPIRKAGHFYSSKTISARCRMQQRQYLTHYSRTLAMDKVQRPFSLKLIDRERIRALGELVSQLEFNIPFQHKYGYIRDEAFG